MMNCGYDPTPFGEYDTPPIAPAMWQAYHIAGKMAAIGIIAAINYRQTTHRGQKVAVSVHNAVSANTETDIPNWVYLRQVHKRQTCRHSLPTEALPAISMTKDGRWMLPYRTYLTNHLPSARGGGVDELRGLRGGPSLPYGRVRLLQLHAVARIPGDLALPHRRVERRPQRRDRSCRKSPAPRCSRLGRLRAGSTPRSLPTGRRGCPSSRTCWHCWNGRRETGELLDPARDTGRLVELVGFAHDLNRAVVACQRGFRRGRWGVHEGDHAVLHAMQASFVGGGPTGSALCRSGRYDSPRSSRCIWLRLRP
jgi:CoA transferase family III